MARPTRRENTIFLLPLTFDEDPIPKEVLKPLSDYAEIFFGMPVKLMEITNMKGRVTDHLNYGVYQVNAEEVLDVMHDLIPSGAFCTAGITMCDLYPREAWNFVFGMAKLSGRCGVVLTGKISLKLWQQQNYHNRSWKVMPTFDMHWGLNNSVVEHCHHCGPVWTWGSVVVSSPRLVFFPGSPTKQDQIHQHLHLKEHLYKFHKLSVQWSEMNSY